jgi:mannose-1-phosphate guanylyltransferase
MNIICLENLRVILLAAGFGTRLRPLTESIPKCLMPINNEPLLEIWLRFLTKNGVKHILVNTHYLHAKVENFIRASPYKKNVLIRREKELLGTAGTLLAAADFISNNQVLLVHADNLSSFNLHDFLHAHNNRPANCHITMMIFRTDNPSSCGIVEVDASGVVIDFQEKPRIPKTNLANAAIYLIEPSFIKRYSSDFKALKDFSTDILVNHVGEIYTFLNDVYHRDIGSKESLAIAQIEYMRLKNDNY